MTRRGNSLVEMMISVAIIGIIAASALGATQQFRLYGAAMLHEERAAAALDYAAEHHVRGTPPDAAVQARLLADLPDARMERTQRGDTVELSVRWRDPMGGPGLRRLTLAGRQP